jgi:hypothetical protein
MEIFGRKPYTWYQLPDQLSIRILCLQPHLDHTSPLHGSLITYSLKEVSDSYEAISYAWGPDKPYFPCTILIGDDTYLKITENLAGALRALRRTTSERLLWADAICIDQQSLVEKSRQVNLMSKIFGLSTRTLVWLGEDDESVPLAFNLCKHLSKSRRSYGLYSVYPFQDGSDDDPIFAENRIALRQDSVQGPALVALLTRDWFWRRWMIQEVALAKAVVVHCGKYTLLWKELANALAVIRLVERTRSSGEVGGWMANAPRYKAHFWEPAWAIAARRLRIEHTSGVKADGHRRPTSPPSSMLEVLSAASLFDCTEPVDCIFSLSALVDDIEFESNYNETVSAAYTRLVDTYLYGQDTCRTRVLHHARLPVTQDEIRLSADIPSYVPNWQILKKWGHFRLGGSGIFKYSAGFRELSQVTKSPYGTPKLAGYGFGGIRYIGLEVTRDAFKQEIKKWFQNYCKGSEHYAQYLTNEALVTAMARTLLVSNRLRATQQLLGSRLSESDYEEFGAQIRKLFDDNLPAESSPSSTQSIRDFSFTPDFGKFIDAALRVLVLRRLAILDGESIALVPEAAKEGDRMVIFSGAETPFIVREVRATDRKCFQLVGECYVHGFMDEIELSSLAGVIFELL